MDFDVAAVAHAYAQGVDKYELKFGDDLYRNDVDREVLEHVLENTARGARVLDVGCGPAQVSAFVEARERSAVAMDVSHEMLLVARRRDAARALVCADVQQLPFAEACCDVAVCRYSIHNLPRSALPSVLRELRRVLRPGGRLLVVTHLGDGEQWLDTQWHGRAERVVITYYTSDELSALLREAGFNDLDIATRAPLPEEHQVDKVYVTGTLGA